MDRRFRWLMTLVLVALCYCPFAARAGSDGGLRSIKLLTPQEGWAANDEDLFWTTDQGLHWEKRTPAAAIQEGIADVLFLNTSIGWVLLAHGDENDQAQFSVASTEDSGKHWHISHVEMPDRIADDFSGRGSMFFLDRLHGWIDLSSSNGSAFRAGAILKTEDGGATWSYAKGQPGVAGSFCFFNMQDGILSGGPENSELYVTHDGSISWQEVSLTAPQVLPADFPTYSTPTCVGMTGFVPVTFSGREGTKAALVLFNTVDAGHAFHVDKVVRNLNETSPGQEIPAAVTDSHLIALGLSSSTGLLLTAVARGGNQLRFTSEVGGAPFAVLAASFATPSQGWALTSTGLLSTADGGTAWTQITPNLERRVFPLDTPFSTQPSSIEPSAATYPDLSSASAAVAKNTRIGFDKKMVPLATQMATWWDSSPYFEMGFYLSRAANKKPKVDPNLDSKWVSDVTAQGWGLMPLWVGPQAPCLIPPPGKKLSDFVLFTKVNTYSQGKAEAAKAIAAARTLSPLLGSIIYYDMENYDTTAAKGCSATVIQFLNGWVDGMQKHMENKKLAPYKAGVYGNPAPAQQDFSQVTPLPDDVWITKTAAKPNTPIVSIWGLKPLCDFFSAPKCTTPLWYHSERIHQYMIDNPETWGTLNFPLVDRDIVDADVAVSSSKPKTYKFTKLTFDCTNLATSSIQTYSINNAGNVVGSYSDKSNALHYFIYSPTSNSCKPVPDPPGALHNVAVGINDAGQIVGSFNTGTYNNGLFVYNGVKTIPIPLTGTALATAKNIYVTNINDDGIIAGTYYGSGGVNYGFLWDTNLSAPSALLRTMYTGKGTTQVGLNGNANVVVVNDFCKSFLYDSILGGYTPINLFASTACPFPNPAPINDNLQIVFQDNSVNPATTTFFDAPSKTSAPFQININRSSFWVPTGINDYSEVVGYWIDSGTGHAHGFIACPQGFPTCPIPE